MPITLTMSEGARLELLDGTVLEEGKRLFVTWPDYIIESLVIKLEEEDKGLGYRRACIGVNWHGLYILVPLVQLVKEKGVRISWSGWR